MAIIKTVNAEGGSDARYDVNQMTDAERQNFDSEGRPLGVGFPDQDTWTQGLPGARGGDSQYSMGGSSGGGGGDLTASPYYQQYQSQEQAAQAADLANTKSQLQQLLIQFGLVPEGFQDKYGALDDTIKALIQKNTDTGISQYARLTESQADAQRTALANLAKRGLSRSGAKGYALQRGTMDFNRALSDSLSSVLANANQLQGGYAGRELDRQSGLSQLLAQLAAQATSFGGGGTSFKQVGAPAPQAPPPNYTVTGNEGIPTPEAALQNVQSAWDQVSQLPGGANYWASTVSSPIPPSSSLWGKVKVTG